MSAQQYSDQKPYPFRPNRGLVRLACIKLDSQYKDARVYYGHGSVVVICGTPLSDSTCILHLTIHRLCDQGHMIPLTSDAFKFHVHMTDEEKMIARILNNILFSYVDAHRCVLLLCTRDDVLKSAMIFPCFDNDHCSNDALHLSTSQNICKAGDCIMFMCRLCDCVTTHSRINHMHRITQYHVVQSDHGLFLAYFVDEKLQQHPQCIDSNSEQATVSVWRIWYEQGNCPAKGRCHVFGPFHGYHYCFQLWNGQLCGLFLESKRSPIIYYTCRLIETGKEWLGGYFRLDSCHVEPRPHTIPVLYGSHVFIVNEHHQRV